MDPKLDPKALADMSGDNDENSVTEAVIRSYVVEKGELPPISAEPFAAYLYQAWFDFGDPDRTDLTNGDVIQGALAFWRGV